MADVRVIGDVWDGFLQDDDGLFDTVLSTNRLCGDEPCVCGGLTFAQLFFSQSSERSGLRVEVWRGLVLKRM